MNDTKTCRSEPARDCGVSDNKDVTDPPPSLAGKLLQNAVVFTKLKKPLPTAASTKGHRSVPASCLSFFKGIKHGIRQ
ncbi:hypothetical protein EMIT0P265_20299 [Pseudomonas zeae]